MIRLLVVLALASAAAACRSTPGAPAAVSADAWATVNGREIKQEAVEKAYRRAAPQTPQSEEEALTAKLTLLNELIVRELLIARAQQLKIELPESELDTAYANAKKNITEDQFQQELSTRKLTPADMRDNMQQDLLAQKVIEREVVSKVVVTDKDITAFYDANRARFNRPEEAYHIAQIVVTPVREAQQSNRSGDDATTAQEAEAKARTLMERLKSGAPFGELAANYSEDAQSAQRGGDLGFVPVSRLKQAPAPLRDAVLKSKPGTVQLVSSGGGHTLVLVVAHDAAGQKDPSMPEVREAITSALRDPRVQLLRAAYLANLRNDAVVVNYLAKRLTETQGKMPSLAPSATGAK